MHAFAERVLPWAARDPIVNNVLSTNVMAVRDGLQSYEDPLWITVLGDDGEVVGAAHHTPPFQLFVCRMPDAAVRAVSAALAPVRGDLPGVTGVIEASSGFAEAWQRETGAATRATVAMRMYQLDVLRPPTGVPGRLRQAAPADRALLIDWVRAFVTEAIPGPSRDHIAQSVDGQIAGAGAGIWEVSEVPVSYAAARKASGGVSRVGPVYTPPAERRHGYGSACTAAVTQLALDRGAESCMLYTDLANPTSNSIYQAIGYRPVSDDAQEYEFTY